MSVKAQSLENQERGMRLATRAGGQPQDDEPEDELQEIKARIEEARSVRPEGRDLHCRDCFNRGRDAAIRKIEGAKET